LGYLLQFPAAGLADNIVDPAHCPRCRPFVDGGGWLYFYSHGNFFLFLPASLLIADDRAQNVQNNFGNLAWSSRCDELRNPRIGMAGKGL
jgi:hypothetical protein